MIKANLYIRVSTDEQADKGYSQRNQEEVLRRYCESNSIQVDKAYFEDHSAKSFIRPQWINLMAELRRTRGKTNLLLFTKWDRFSRNAGDAYQMLSSLNKLGVEAQAVEQPLDISVPENKMMLAVYLAAPEVENDRRALNVLHGMRRAKKEGRWMGGAPAGYSNKITENGRKFIAPIEPAASLMKWSFEELAKGVLNTEHIWRITQEKGLRCSKNNFWRLIRNPVYCGWIQISKYKNEEKQLARGTHEPIISEELFYHVQDVLDGRRIGIGTKVTSDEKLPLRGFLECPNCQRALTGSASKGRNQHYYYYHCTPPCGFRLKVEDAHALLEKELKKYVPHPGLVELYKKVISEVNENQTHHLSTDRRKILNEMDDLNARLSKSRELLLTGVIDPCDYKTMKAELEEKINRLEMRLSSATTTVRNIEKVLQQAANALSHLDVLYRDGNVAQKRHIIGSIFTKKLVFEKTQCRTAEVNEPIALMYMINSELKGKKNGTLNDFTSTSREVHL